VCSAIDELRSELLARPTPSTPIRTGLRELPELLAKALERHNSPFIAGPTAVENRLSPSSPTTLGRHEPLAGTMRSPASVTPAVITSSPAGLGAALAFPNLGSKLKGRVRYMARRLKSARRRR